MHEKELIIFIYNNDLMVEGHHSSYDSQTMVQYKLIITPDNSYKTHGREPYWEITAGINVPPQWKDVPGCILEEWLSLIPEPTEQATIGGTKYSLQNDLLLPKGQLSYFILTEHDIHIQENRRQHPERFDLESSRVERQQHSRPRSLELNRRTY